MSDKSSIEWTDATWNPTRGCSKIAQGCKHCYAETFAERFRGVPGHPYELGFDPRLAPDKLTEPLKWKKPRRIFVDSMSDLFHESFPFEYIAAAYGVMAACPLHTFQVLTKRAMRAAEFYRWLAERGGIGKYVRSCKSNDEALWGPYRFFAALTKTEEYHGRRDCGNLTMRNRTRKDVREMHNVHLQTLLGTDAQREREVANANV